jgi:hypothetical protein
VDSFRSPFLRISLLTLVFIGQAHSFGVLWNLKQRGVKGDKILKILEAQEAPPKEAGYLVCDSRWQEQLLVGSLPFHSREEAVSFKMEPFLISLLKWPPPRPLVFKIFPTTFPFEEIAKEPDAPPPKRFS